MADFNSMARELGVKQAKAGLPLTFIQNDKISLLQTEDRLKSLELTKPLKKILNSLLSSNNIEQNDYNMAEMVLMMSTAFVTLSKSTNTHDDFNKLTRFNHDLLTGNHTVTEGEGQYLKILSKSSVESVYMTANEKSVGRFYNQELNTRQSNSLKRCLDRYFGHSESQSEMQEYRAIAGLKLNLEKNKITTMAKPKELITFVPVPQLLGYLGVFDQLVKGNLIHVNYFRRDFKEREQYVSRNPNFLSVIYSHSPKVVEVLTNHERNTNFSDEAKMLKDYPEEFVTGSWQLADLGIGVDIETPVATILRKVTPINVLSLDVQPTPSQELINKLEESTEYSLNSVVDVFNMNVNSKGSEDLDKIIEMMKNKNDVVYVKEDNDLPILSVQNSALLTQEVYTTTGLRAILNMMLEHPEQFKVLKSGEIQTSGLELKHEEYKGNLGDILDF